MKYLKALVILVALFGLTVVSVKAQRLNDEVRLTIPFKVKVGEVTLQPGEYVIDQFNSPSTRNLLVIQAKNGDRLEVKNVALTQWTQARKIPDQAKVVFREVGDWHFFDTVWVPGKELGYYFPPSHFEREVIREVALKQEAARRAALAASRPPTPPPEQKAPEVTEEVAEVQLQEPEPIQSTPSAPPEETKVEPTRPVERADMEPVQSASSMQRRLPKTATQLPLLGAIGLVLVMVSLTLKRLL
jgi:hypothetical protein